MGHTYVQLPQATHFSGLMYIVFPLRKKRLTGALPMPPID
jgi:hypothetical protein